MNNDGPFASKLSAQERDKLAELIDPLAKFLEAPGSWGYGTQLGEFTISVLRLQRALRELNHAK